MDFNRYRWKHAALSIKLGQETDVDKAQAIVVEMKEVLHRVDLVQKLQFRQTSTQLERAVANVKAQIKL
jgi:hypothetical protein